MEIERFLIDVIQYSVWFYTMLCCEVQYYYLFYITVLYFAMRYCTVLCYAVLYYAVLYCIVQYCTVLCHAVLYCTLLCGTVLYFAMLCCTVLCYAALYRTLLCGTVLYCTVLYCTAMYSTLKKYFSSPLEALYKIFNRFLRDRVSILHMTSASPYHRLKTFIYLSASSRIQRNLFISTL